MYALTVLLSSAALASALALPVLEGVGAGIKRVEPRASTIPVMCTGRLVVNFLNTNIAPWLSQYPDNTTGLYGNMTDLSAFALAVTIPCITSEPSNLVALNGPNTTLPNVGLITAPGNPAAISVGSDSYGTIGPTATAPNNSVPFAGANGFFNTEGESELIESAVWMFDPEGHSLSASWKDANGTTTPAQLFWNAQRQWLGFTGDFGALNATYGGTNQLEPVALSLDMTPTALVDLPLLNDILK